MELNKSYSKLTCHPAVIEYRYFGALLGILVTAVGTVGNIMTLLAFATDKKIRTRFNLLILNLTLADLCYCTFLQPVIVDTFIHFTWRQGDLMCRVFGLFLFVAHSVSIFNLVLIAISRYILISDPKRFDRVYSRYTMPLFMLGPWALGFSLFGPLWNIFVFLPPVCTCSCHRSRGRPYTFILLIFMFGLGVSSIGIFYFLINRKVKAASKALEEYRIKSRTQPNKNKRKKSQIVTVMAELSQTDSGVDSAVSQSANESQNTQKFNTDDETGYGPQAPESKVSDKINAYQSRKNHNNEFKRVTRMCFAMFVVYVTCYLPFCLMHIADRRERAPILAHMIAGNFTWLNSCINPILYVVMNRQFREAYKGVLTKAANGFRRLLGLRRD
ncbi:G-protein coupled receptor 84-like [Callorhinchus milii]|uniref:G-protein coupled receptor 84-like n=1 Tax=Callorhinchus milii TaxID=7868 RepID=UPI001C3FCD53|nr:G-protein coupled receptor 84-like [Callorhinchus milii]